MFDTPHGLPAVRFITVDEESAGQRLDNFLMRHLKGVPKTHIYRIIRSGEVRINKGRCGADTRVNIGDLIRVPPIRMSHTASGIFHMNGDNAEQGLIHPPARDFEVIFEDDDFIAIDKPAGVAVHGGSGVSFGVIEQLRRARPQAKFLELVHRLDRETSGILLIAKKRRALLNLQEQFKSRETGKTYLALVLGAWPANKNQTIDTPLRKYLLPDGERRVRITTREDKEGMPALTLARPFVGKIQAENPHISAHQNPRTEFGLPAMTLLEVTIKTGRTHQIRVHLASMGHAIAGDEKYGDFEINKRLHKIGLKRMFLHAWRLRVRHPSSAQVMTFFAALPENLSRALLPNHQANDEKEILNG